MGRSTTPTFVISVKDVKFTHEMVWDVKRYGKPTTQNIEAYLRTYAKSFEVGGVNEHISESLGYVPYPVSAKIIRQATKEIVVDWKAPMFFVW